MNHLQQTLRSYHRRSSWTVDYRNNFPLRHREVGEFHTGRTLMSALFHIRLLSPLFLPLFPVHLLSPLFLQCV